MESILEWDKKLFLLFNFNGGTFWDEFFWTVSGKLTWIPLHILIIILIYRRYGWQFTLLAVVFIALAIGAADQICNFFKDSLPKPRPTHNPDFEGMISIVCGYRGGLSGTVSAHAATAFSIMTVSSALVREKWFTVMMVVWASLVGYSRIYIGAHYPLDVFFGAVTGIIVGVFAVRLLRLTEAGLEKLKMKRSTRPPQ